ncbi:hypothetical protein [Campylobacter pinnipediorum]|uniref:hypothetical protein n=1 Tax=Campylobacter pinnipediorum TaxID=1965231 RepID=UPI001F2CA682|nr:hypothetical protein [Campylobacter pinnipediorum]
MNNGTYEIEQNAYYEPNSYGDAQENKEFLEPDLALEGLIKRYDHRELDDDCYSQPRDLFNLMNDSQKEQLLTI